MQVVTRLLLCVLLLGNSACAARRATAPPAPEARADAATPTHLVSLLFFGLSSADGAGVSDQQWQRFLDEVATPRLGGLTVIDAEGRFKPPGGSRVEREESKVLIIVHRPADETLLDELRRIYCERFNQNSVLKLTARGRACF